MLNSMTSDLYNINTAVLLHQAGKLDEAEVIYRHILSATPTNADALHLMGVVAYQRKQYERAEELILLAIAANKRIPDYRNNLGNVYRAQKQLDKAEECYLKALKLNPKYMDARNNLGNILRDQGKLTESAAQYRKAIALEPGRPEFHNNLGMVLQALGRNSEAVASYAEAVRLKPDFVDALSNLASAHKSLGNSIESMAICSKALAVNPSHPKTLLHLGNVYSDLGNLEKGITCFRKALSVEPDFCEAHLNLGHMLREQGEQQEALEHFQKALDINPRALPVRFGDCIGQIPLLHNSVAEIQQARERYAVRLEAFCRDLDLSDPISRVQAIGLVGSFQPFFLAYQGENDRDLQSLYGNLMVRIQSTCFPALAKKRPLPPVRPGEPLRIGIVSGFFFMHSNWKIPIKGWMDNLDRKAFRLYGYHTGRPSDEQTALARSGFYRFTENLNSLEQWCEQICNDQLHVLIFPEIGMDPMTVQLAALRLAPIQCTSWGHPNTSGLPTLDYYLSSDLMEPEDADDHYTEKLVRLPNLSIYYEPPEIEAADVDRSYFGLSADAVVFLCTQSLFKYLPQFDEVFPRIAAEVGSCQFAFLNYSKSPRLALRFKTRLEASFARFGLNCDDYIKFLPHLSPAHYRALNRQADVFLDSIGWSGCNSTLEALACDLPVVTMPGKMMRGRHTHAIMKMMDFNETEAQTIDEYVALAGRLGTDSAYRKYISEKMSRLKHLACRDLASIRGLEQFLQNAVAAFPSLIKR